MFKTNTPLIVDVKPSDICGFGCTFCYEDSTMGGKECTPERFLEIAKYLDSIGVQQIAIGGGDPRFFWGDRFVETIITLSRETDFIINFTTRSNILVQEFFKVAPSDKHFGIGYSAITPNSYNELLKKAPENIHVVLQYVTRLLNPSNLFSLIENTDERGHILLLGYKEIGRGKTFVSKELSSEELKMALRIAEERGVTLSVDTLLVKQYPFLKEIYPDRVLDREGLYSCYVDITEDLCFVSPASYLKDQSAIYFPRENFEELFLDSWKEIKEESHEAILSEGV